MMGPLDAAWHLLNLAAPAVGVALVAASLTKLMWRRELVLVPWRRLVICAAIAGAVALIAGLIVFGRDGKMATYAALVTGCALALWWAGFTRR